MCPQNCHTILQWFKLEAIKAVYIQILHSEHKYFTLLLSALVWRVARTHDDVIKWKHFPRYWPFVRGIHRLPVNSPYKGQWRGALRFSLISARRKGWANNRDTGDFRRHRAHSDITVIYTVGVKNHRKFYSGCWFDRLPCYVLFDIIYLLAFLTIDVWNLIFCVYFHLFFIEPVESNISWHF